MLATIEGLWGIPDAVLEHVEHVREATTLVALVIAGLHLGLALGAWVVQAELSTRGKWLRDRPECPVCGRTLESQGLVPRTVHSVLGALTWRRRVWRCPQRCPIGHIAPYDEELGLAPYQQSSGELQQIACEYAVFMPFHVSAHFVNRIFNMAVSAGSLWNWVQRSGADASLRVQQAIDALNEAEAQDGREAGSSTPAEGIRQLPLVIGGDGVMVPFRPQAGTPAL